MHDIPQLITYADRLAGDIDGVRRLLDGPLAGAFGGVHLLPFYVPIDGSDAGFDPIDHTAVDRRLGDWADVTRLADGRRVMADLIVNHVSRDSMQFRDWLENGDESSFADLFITPEKVFGTLPSAAQLDTIYRPRPTPVLHDVEFADGSVRPVWSTFTHDQIDIDVESDAGWSYLTTILDRFAASGIELVRLDAVGYAIKRPGTSCFMIPETYAFIDRLAGAARSRGMDVLVEIHGYHRDQLDIAARVDRVYDFALPPLAIDALTTGDDAPLRRWIEMRPTNSVNVLDTHDGIGVIDVGIDQRDRTRSGLLAPDRIDALVDGIHDRSNGASRRATGAAASNLDLYQVNCTFHDALGGDDARHLAARLIQMMLPGVAQVYYVGLLAGTNDLDLLERTGVGRDVNRHHYTADEVRTALDSDFTRALVDLLRWRSTHRAFGGSFELVDAPAGSLRMRWTTGDSVVDREIDLTTAAVTIHAD